MHTIYLFAGRHRMARIEIGPTIVVVVAAVTVVWVSCPRRWSRGAREEQGDGIVYLLQLASGAGRSATDLASARSADVPGGFIAGIVDDQRRGLQLAVPAPISSDQPAS